MKNNKKDNKNWLKLLVFFLLGGFLVKLFTFLFNKKKLDLDDIKDNLDDFIDEEKEEVEELTEGKESLKKYCHDSLNIFKDYFVPHDGNDHKPKILRAKPLLIIVFLSILLKVGVLSYLFFICPNMAKMQQQITTDILVLTNQDRQNNNLPALEINSVLSSAAQNKANDMIANNYFSHYGLDGKEPWDWIDRGEYSYLYVGENLAMNFSSADSAHSALMQSALHKKNILNNNYRDIGLAVVTGEMNGEDTTILVELFGSRKETELLAVKIATEKNEEINSVPVKIVETETKVLATETIQPEVKPSTITPVENIPVTEENKINETSSETKQIDTTKNSQENIITLIEPTTDLNKEISYVTPQASKEIGIANTLIKFSKYFYIILLIITVVILLINIFVRIGIQHKSVIIQSLLVILLLTGFYFVKLHVLENLLEKIAII